jgi:hypothetical protein
VGDDRRDRDGPRRRAGEAAPRHHPRQGLGLHPGAVTSFGRLDDGSGAGDVAPAPPPPPDASAGTGTASGDDDDNQ